MNKWKFGDSLSVAAKMTAPDSTIQNRDLQHEQNSDTFGSIFNLSMLSTILVIKSGCNDSTVHHRDLQLSLGQSSISKKIFCHQSNHQNCQKWLLWLYHSRQRQLELRTTKFGSIFNLNTLSVILGFFHVQFNLTWFQSHLTFLPTSHQSEILHSLIFVS